MPDPIETAKQTGDNQPRAYNIKLYIGNENYSLDLLSVRILSSLSTAYQSVFLTVLVDPTLVIEKDIFGTSKLELKIQLLGQNQIASIIEEVVFDLLYLKSDTLAIQKVSKKGVEEQTKVPFSIITVCRKPWISMNTTVNSVLQGVKMQDILEGLAKDVDVTLELDTEGLNSEVIDQVVIPPTTFYTVIKEFKDETDPYDGYLDQRFGIFQGVPGVFCRYDNKLFIKNLSARMVKAPSFLLYHLPAGEQTKDIIEKSLQDFPRIYYTFENIKMNYAGNAKLASLSSFIRHIVKPSNTLFKTKQIDMDENAQHWGLTTQRKALELDKDIRKTKLRYKIDDTGYDDVTTSFEARAAASFADLTTMTVSLERNLRLINLMDVGESVEYKPFGLEETTLAGKYILWSSDLQFKKAGIWEASASINLVRTNRKQSEQSESVGMLHIPLTPPEPTESPLPQPSSGPDPGKRDSNKLSPDQLTMDELIDQIILAQYLEDQSKLLQLTNEYEVRTGHPWSNQ